MVTLLHETWWFHQQKWCLFFNNRDISIDAIDVPNSHWLVDEKNGFV
jgi:hypothetical protein